MKSTHQLNVEAFMLRAEALRLSKGLTDGLQAVPVVPMEPSQGVRVLRAKLIMEEALETIRGLGVRISLCDASYSRVTDGAKIISHNAMFDYEAIGTFDMVEVIDGCCDLKVVTTGTLSSCGVPDEPFQALVDNNNLNKFGPGCSVRDDGKLVKPAKHVGPDIAGLLNSLTLIANMGKRSGE